MRWLLAVPPAVVLLVANGVGAGAQGALGAPTGVATTATATTLAVTWTAPADSGGSAITAYDLRYVPSSASDKADANWTLLEDVWETGGGALAHTLTGLRDQTSYDIQVRAVTGAGDGPWSSPAHVAETSDRGNTNATATPLSAEAPASGRIEPAGDADWFEIQVATTTRVWVYSTGATNTRASLLSGSTTVASNDNVPSPFGTHNFGFEATLTAGTTYVLRVAGSGAGPYEVRIVSLVEPAETREAAPEITLGRPARGHNGSTGYPRERNFFKFTLAEASHLFVFAIGDSAGSSRIDTEVQVSYLAQPGHPYHPPGTALISEYDDNDRYRQIPGATIIRTDTPLQPGTYYVDVQSPERGSFTLYPLIPDEPGATRDLAAPLELHRLATGALTGPGSVNYFVFDVERDSLFVANIESYDAPDRPVVTVEDGDGNTKDVFSTIETEEVSSVVSRFRGDVQVRLDPGTYFLKIAASSAARAAYLVQAGFDRKYADLRGDEDCAHETVSDALYGCQWYLRAFPGVNVESVWQTNKGENIKVAVVDQGVQTDHEDLVDNIATTGHHDYYGDGLYSADLSHGTSTAGLIAARDNDVGVRGVAPRATIYSYNLAQQVWSGADSADALLRNQDLIAVSVNAYGFNPGHAPNMPPPEWEQAARRGVTEGYGNKGIVYVFSAGNGGSGTGRNIGAHSNLDGYANYFAVMTVCSVDYTRTLATYSEEGPNLWVCGPSGASFGVGGPRGGQGLVTTSMGHDYTDQFTGTSASAPLVAGVAALVRAANANLSWRDVKLILAASAHRPQPTSSTWRDGAQKYISPTERSTDTYRYSRRYGFGAVDGAAAVALAADWNPVPAMREIEISSGTLDVPIPAAGVLTLELELDNYIDFVEFIEVEVLFQHWMRALDIRLESPAGRVSVLSPPLTANQILVLGTTNFFMEDEPFRFGSARHLGESAAGTWKLSLDNDLLNNIGNFKHWRIKAYGHGASPGFPPAPTATPGVGTLTIGWSAPADIGQSAITSYDLRYIASDETDRSAENWTTHTAIGTTDAGIFLLTGLGRYKAYDIQVRAVNATGAGPWSPQLTATTALEPPLGPSVESVEPGNEKLFVAWAPNPDEGSGEITRYDLRYYPKTTVPVPNPIPWTVVNSVWTTGSGELRNTISGLANGVEHLVAVRAWNAAGEGEWGHSDAGTPERLNLDPAFPNPTAGFAVREDVAPNHSIGSVPAATDSEGHQLFYSIVGGADLFAVEERTGRLTTAAELDYERAIQHVFQVGVSDRLDADALPDAATDDLVTVTVSVEDVDEPADISFVTGSGVTATDNALEVDENHAGALANLAPTDPEGDATLTYTWSLGGTDERDFAITPAGVLSFASPPDYDRPEDFNRDNVYTVTANALDSGGKTGRVVLTVTVRNVDEPPAITGDAAIVVNENTTGQLDRYSAVDPEGTTTTFTWTLAGDDAGAFSISDTGVLTFDRAPDHELPADSGRDNVYTVIVQATDDGGTDFFAMTGELEVAVTVEDVDEPPEITGTDTFVVAENGSTFVGNYTATDPEGAVAAWLSLTGADARFFVFDTVTGRLSFAETPDFDRSTNGNHGPEYRVTVRASDEGNRVRNLPVTITLTDVDEGPLISGPEEVTLSEIVNPGVGQVVIVGTYTKLDPEGSSSNWGPVGSSVVLSGRNSDAFAFDQANGRLTFASPPDYEDGGASHAVTLSANDGSLNGALDVAITITNLDERGSVSFDRRTLVINRSITATLADPDNIVSASWQWQRSRSRTGGWTDITNADSSSYTPGADDRDHYLRARVTYEDGHGPGKSAEATTEFTTVNERGSNTPPVLPDAVDDIAIPEDTPGGRIIGSPVRATDGESDPLVYSLSGASEFVVGRTTGQIRVADGAAFDYDQGQRRYSLTVTADDGFGGTDTVAVTVRVTDVNEPPEALDDAPASFDEDTPATIDVLANDTDPEGGVLTLAGTLASGPRRGRAAVDTATNRITYTPDADYHGADSFTYRVQDDGSPSLSNTATVSITVLPVNDVPAFAAATAEREVSEQAEEGGEVGAPVRATDVDGDRLGYTLTGPVDFDVDEDTGQIRVAPGAALVPGQYEVTVRARDPRSAEASIVVTITVTAGPAPAPGGGGFAGGGGGGGGGGASGPTPSEADYEWTVKEDIEALVPGNGTPTGMWSDGETLWVLDNPDGAGDGIYAYDLESGERLAGREFPLHERNRAPRGAWSDGEGIVWVADSGRDRLFAYDLGSGERLEERDIELAKGNGEARGIWSDGETMWVLNRNPSLYAYDLGTGELLGGYGLDARNRDPQGIWSDGVSLWVSDHGLKQLWAYRLPRREEVERAGEGASLDRVREEDFTHLSGASNNSPRGVWSDGEVMYVADGSDDKVYSYNLPDAIDARLTSLTLAGVDIGEFDPGRGVYEGAVGAGLTETTVAAAAVQRGTRLVIDPPDADGNGANGHQVTLAGVSELTVTVTSADGSRERVYRVVFDQPPPALALEAGWTAITWPGADGAALAEVLPEGVVAVYTWDEAAGAWRGYFPALSNVPALNTLTTLSTGVTYWVAVEEPLTWTVPAGATVRIRTPWSEEDVT